MNVKKHQKKPLEKDLRLGVILVALLALLFGLYLVNVGINTFFTVMSFVAFILFVSPYVLSGNPTLIKVMRSDCSTSPNRVWHILGLLWILLQLYALTTSQFNIFHAAKTALWLGIAGILIRVLKQSKAPSLIDYLLVILMWIPIELGLFNSVTIPPAQGMVNPATLIGLAVLIYAYLVVREFDIGFTYRLTGEDYRVVVLDFIIFFLIAIIIGIVTGFLSIARHMPPLTDLVVRFAAIFFFIALPEELLFRGVIFNLLRKQFKNQRRSVGIAMVISSVIFGLAHINNPVAPFFDVNVGASTLAIPWAYVLLATIAGFFYCFVFIRTKKITAAAVIHLLVDWAWYAFFN